jgi:hypothetical protein
MRNELNSINAIDLPQELVPVLMESGVCEYASLKKNGTPITSPVIPFPGEDGRTIDVQTGLTYATKAERARNNPHVCLLYSEPKTSPVESPPTVLVYGQATVYDSDLQANTDRYARLMPTKFQLIRQIPAFILRRATMYLARIWIAVTPLKLLWWPEGDMGAAPQQWHPPEGTQAPPSDPPPEPLPTPYKPLADPPTDWRLEIAYALDRLGTPILTVVDEDGYPVPFRVRGGFQVADGVHLDLPLAMPTNARGRACLTFHTMEVKDGEVVSNENMSFVGEVSGDGGDVLFKVERCLPCLSAKRDPAGLFSLLLGFLRMRKRLEVEAARRGQLVPIVRLPKNYGNR